MISGPATTASVILCVKNGGDLLLVQLDAIARQEAAVDWELLVVDNGSTDNTASLVRRWLSEHPSVPGRLLDASHRVGLAAARNLGAAASERDLLLFCDADDEADPHWVQGLADALQVDPMAAGFLELTRLNAPKLLQQRANLLPTNPESAYGRPFAVGANFGIRRETYVEVGGCDEALLNAGEDLDLSWRVMALGHHIGRASAAVMHYRLRSDTKSYLRQQYLYGKAGAAFLFHPGHGLDAPQPESAVAWLAKNLPRAVIAPGGPQAFELRQRIAYRRGVWAGRRQHAATSTPDSPEPVDLVTEVELSCPALLDLGATAKRARVMLRLHGAPLGFAALTGEGEQTHEQVLSQANEDVHAALALHLSADGLSDMGASTPHLPCQFPGPWGDPDAFVTVVIGTRDRPEHLREALSSLLACRGTFEIVVADNAPSTRATEELVEELADDRVRYLRISDAGVSHARNQGAAVGRGDLIAFTDDDVRADPGWIEGLVRAFTHEENIGLVTGMVAAAERRTPSQVYFDERVSWSKRCSPATFRLPAGKQDPLFPFRGGDLGTGANMAVTRRAFDAVGGYDRALGPGTPARGGEDLDVFARLLLAGWVARYEPSAILWHTHRSEVADLLVQMRGYGSGLTAYLAKHALTRAGGPRLLRGLVGGLLRMGEQHTTASGPVLGPEMVRQERIGLLEGPLLYARGRRARSRG